MIHYSTIDLLFYLLLYSFIGWAVGVACLAIKDRHFINRGFLNLPLAINEGITSVILLTVLPTMEGNLLRQFLLTWVIVYIVDELAQQFLKNVSRRSSMDHAKTKGLSRWVKLILRTTEALFYLMMYLLVHPFIALFVNWLPELLITILVVVMLALVALDYFGVRHALRTGGMAHVGVQNDRTQGLADRMTAAIWRRLEKAYPGIERAEPENRSRYTFAKGICFDKLVWVFLASSFLGALIEMVYCRAVGGTWMNRSSVLYGAFSFVWGFGAVVLTVVLQRLAGKPDRYVFLAGFIVGGAYEYLCSVFTEIVFGTVFWDYNEMPLNIGGRTNVLFCIFWGLLSVLWIKVLYPPMDKSIERIPPLTGKILTWIIIAAMVFNGLLTAAAMVRYTERQTSPEPSGFIEAFLDERYDDDWMERRWPNMKLT